MKPTSFQIIPPKRIREFFQDSKVDPELEAKRSSIFNPELKDLVQKVTSPTSSDAVQIVQEQSSVEQYSSSKSIPSRMRSIYSDLVEPSKEEEFKTLLSLYSDASTIQESSIMKYSSFLLNRIGVEHFGWYFLSYDSQAYFCEMSTGLDSVTRTNFLFLKNDPFVKLGEDNFFELEITPNLIMDPFFSKKFSLESINLYGKILFFFLNQPGIDACLVAFVPKHDLLKKTDEEDEIDTNVISPRWIQMIHSKLNNLIPGLANYRDKRVNSKAVTNDMLTHSIYLFKSFVGERFHTSYSHVIKIEKYLETENIYFIKRQFISKLMKTLNSREKLMELNIDTFLLIGDKDHSDFIVDQAELDSLNVKINTKIYPTYGENILLYI